VVYLNGNQLPIPPEILNQNSPVVINFYLKHAESIAKKPLHEAKVLIVGQGGVGKTQVINRLLYKKYNDKEAKTDGIDIHRWNIKHDNREFKLNIWDFGGQEIMHATHQFFFTKRSLYLLVWDARQEDRYGQIDYWLKLIQSFSGDSPVIIVLNKCDVGNIDLDRQNLKNKYPNIKEFLCISCKKNMNLDQLQNAVGREISQLPHINDELLNSWFDIKDYLESMEYDYIEYQEYKRICETKGLDQLDQETLIGFLHDLGTVINFRTDLRLRDVNILDPEWVTCGVYKILNYKPLSCNGILNGNKLNKILDTTTYPSHKHPFIIDMMKKFELCFEFEAVKNCFLIPDLLPLEPPNLENYNEYYKNSLRFEYQYNFFPTSIISRFIVRMHNFIIDKLYWKNGVVLKNNDNSAIIKADRDNRKVSIWLFGKKNTSRDFLAKIRGNFDHIHSTIPRIEAEEMIPLYYDKDICVSYDYLIGLDQKGMNLYYAPKTFDEFEVQKLLNGIDDNNRQKKRDSLMNHNIDIHVNPNIQVNPTVSIGLKM